MDLYISSHSLAAKLLLCDFSPLFIDRISLICRPIQKNIGIYDILVSPSVTRDDKKETAQKKNDLCTE